MMNRHQNNTADIFNYELWQTERICQLLSQFQTWFVWLSPVTTLKPLGLMHFCYINLDRSMIFETNFAWHCVLCVYDGDRLLLIPEFLQIFLDQEYFKRFDCYWNYLYLMKMNVWRKSWRRMNLDISPILIQWLKLCYKQFMFLIESCNDTNALQHMRGHDG